MQSHIRNGLYLFAGLVTVLLIASPALAQGTLFVEGNNVGVGTPTPSHPLHISKSDGTAKILVEETSGTTAVRELFKLSNNGGPFFVFTNTALAKSWAFATLTNNDFTINQQQNAGIEYRFSPTGNLTISGSLSQGSSRSRKSDIETIDAIEILDRVLRLPIAEWSYIGDDGVRHLGPMAEDFREAFGLGASPAALSTLDTSGVALAAIQGLHRQLEARDSELARMREENRSLSAAQAELVDRLEKLEARVTSPADR